MVLVFHFTTSFSGCLQRRFLNLVEHLQGKLLTNLGFEILSPILVQVYKLSQENSQQETMCDIKKTKGVMGQ